MEELLNTQILTILDIVYLAYILLTAYLISKKKFLSILIYLSSLIIIVELFLIFFDKWTSLGIASLIVSIIYLIYIFKYKNKK